MTNHDFKLNNEMIYLIETLKVESYWCKENFTLTLQNKDIQLLDHIEAIVNSLGIRVSKRTLLKIKLKDNTKRNEVNLYINKNKINFHISKSPFDINQVKAVTSLPYKERHTLILETKDKNHKIIIKTSPGKLNVKSDLQCWVYGDLRFPTKKLLDFLQLHLKGNKNIQVEDILFKSPPNIVMSAFSALVDCEGTLNWYGLKRNIQIRMNSKEYLLQWKELLEKFEIGCRFEKNQSLWGIVISGWEDFDRLERLGFKLIHSKKAEKWKRMMNGYKRRQISRGTFKEFYIKKLKEVNKKVTTKEFAEILNKDKRTINHFLLKLEKEGFVICDRSNWPYLYSISK